MEWISSLLIEHSVIQAVVLISLISAVGLALGRITVFGVSLGVTFVFFVGILSGHFGFSISDDMLNYAESFGLILFVYALGLQVGPSFFSSLGRGGLQLNLLAMGVVLVGVLMTVLLHFATGVSLPDMVGILSGSVTNTPALGAAQQTLKQLSLVDPALAQSDIALSCAVSYPLGVVGVIFALIFIRKFFPVRQASSDSDENRAKEPFVSAFEVKNPSLFGKSIREVGQLTDRKFVISRLWRSGTLTIPTSETLLQGDDKLLIITSERDVDSLTMIFGSHDDKDWNSKDIDWNSIDSELQSRRIVVTREEINGKKLGSLRLRNLYGVNVTRVHRAGVLLLATPDLRLQIGDRLTLVGEQSAIANVEKFVGNAIKSLKEPNLIGVYVGLVLGLVLGSMPIIFPGMSFPVKLGIAGGPIIVGILMGAFGPRFHLITYTTLSANLMLRGLGLSMYLACLGLDAGSDFFATVFRPEGLLWVALGFLLTVVPVLLVAFVSLRFLGLDYGSVAGMLCGSMSNPMALNYANGIVPGDSPSVSYATVYPLTMFVRVIVAQLLLMLFL